MIRKPPFELITAFVNSALTSYGGTAIINGWSILNNLVNDRIVVDQKVPQVMNDPADVHDLGLSKARVPEYLKDMVLRSQLPHPVDTLSWLGRLSF